MECPLGVRLSGELSSGTGYHITLTTARGELYLSLLYVSIIFKWNKSYDV